MFNCSYMVCAEGNKYLCESDYMSQDAETLIRFGPEQHGRNVILS